MRTLFLGICILGLTACGGNGGGNNGPFTQDDITGYWLESTCNSLGSETSFRQGALFKNDGTGINGWVAYDNNNCAGEISYINESATFNYELDGTRLTLNFDETVQVGAFTRVVYQVSGNTKLATLKVLSFQEKTSSGVRDGDPTGIPAINWVKIEDFEENL